MQPWSAPDVPTLPGASGLPAVFDTMSGAPRPVGSLSSASIYVCGITPYDATHLGHAATYVAFDLLNRAWRDAGADVSYVQNITDVDDPLLERADATGEQWESLAAREISLFRDDMTALRVLPPAHYVGVVDSIPLIVRLIERLRAAGAAYDVDGDVYFSIDSARDFGAVSHLDQPTMLRLFGERGGDPDRAGKKNALDSLLWRAERPGEPAWESSLGRGRPGWHVECSAIALNYLGGFADPIDVQGGGSDLVFPHHEMCAAQVGVATGHVFARAYVHAGMVGFDGEKMSKSRGNLVFVSKLLASGVEPAAIRLALLAHHYRGDWEWTDDDLSAARDRLAVWRAAASLARAPSADALLGAVRDRLADDLDAPGALAAVDSWAANATDAAGDADPGAPALMRATVDALLGVAL